MHRSSFRARKQPLVAHEPRSEVHQPKPDKELEAIREQIENVSKKLSPLTASVERLAAPKQDISVPGDIAQALRLAHGRLDRLEEQQKVAIQELRRMATAFSNAILKLSERVEKHEGALAHSLEELIFVLSNRKLRIKRDNDGNMVELETEL